MSLEKLHKGAEFSSRARVKMEEAIKLLQDLREMLSKDRKNAHMISRAEKLEARIAALISRIEGVAEPFLRQNLQAPALKIFNHVQGVSSGLGIHTKGPLKVAVRTGGDETVAKHWKSAEESMVKLEDMLLGRYALGAGAGKPDRQDPLSMPAMGYTPAKIRHVRWASQEIRSCIAVLQVDPNQAPTTSGKRLGRIYLDIDPHLQALLRRDDPGLKESGSEKRDVTSRGRI